jgi:hypothetical protein
MKYIIHPVLLFLCMCLSGCQLRDKPANKTDFQLWLKEPENTKKANELKLYLAEKRLADIFPLEQLLRSDVRWRSCKAEPFTVPPKQYWLHIGRTLLIIKKEIVPLVGPVEALSVFRAPGINRCIRGAKQSFHLKFHAIDMKTKVPINREKMLSKLCGLYRHKGKSLNLGLGIYTAQRFHIDAAGYRTWGNDHKSSSSPCRYVVAPQHKLR